MAPTTFPYEDLLQRLLAEHPSVPSSVHSDDQVGQDWLLVTREAGVPDEEGGTGRWSLDHLFLDREGIPTLIEVKRSSDTRIRREVVGQMLDYAANSVAYWPIEKVQSFFADTVRDRDDGADPDLVLEEFVGTERSPSEFWEDVKTKPEPVQKGATTNRKGRASPRVHLLPAQAPHTSHGNPGLPK